MSNQKYINDNGIVSFNGYMGKAPMSVDATVGALNAMNLLCEGYESQITKLTEQNKLLREALAFCEPHADWALQGQMFNKGIAAAKKILEETKC